MATAPALLPPQEGALGPAMRALDNENQRAFVVAWLELGGAPGKATEAAMVAGYCPGNRDSAKVTAYRLMHNEKILAAIREEADKRLHAGVLLGASVLVEIAQNPLHKNQMKAALALLDRGGLQIATLNKHLHVVEDNRTDKQIEDIIRDMAIKQGLDPKKLLGNSAKVVDAEFSEVEPQGSSEGLEDLLG